MTNIDAAVEPEIVRRARDYLRDARLGLMVSAGKSVTEWANDILTAYNAALAALATTQAELAQVKGELEASRSQTVAGLHGPDTNGWRTMDEAALETMARAGGMDMSEIERLGRVAANTWLKTEDAETGETDWLEIVRAVLRAVREPSEVMVRAGMAHEATDLATEFTAMIDAILNEPASAAM